MPVSGLVITLDADPDKANAALKQLQAESHFELGERQGHKQPAVLETPDPETDKKLWQWVNALEGIVLVDVIMIHFDDDQFDKATFGKDLLNKDVFNKEAFNKDTFDKDPEDGASLTL